VQRLSTTGLHRLMGDHETLSRLPPSFGARQLGLPARAIDDAIDSDCDRGSSPGGCPLASATRRSPASGVGDDAASAEGAAMAVKG
jgi:hypothetical protein